MCLTACLDCHNVFALMCRSNQELKEKLYSFMITDETVDKSHFLRQLCRQMANTVCKADAVSNWFYSLRAMKLVFLVFHYYCSFLI